LLIRWAEIYANTEVLSPIDRDTWRVIGETSGLGARSRVIELASGKGVFASYLAKTFGCTVDGFDINPEFIDYSNNRVRELGIQSRVRFSHSDINQL
jgi:cyclopropane fatty-acyl-phospholipid synthase-like methyltransferase